jgi:2-methylisocitrate lyase-like PEP mutase family enzyme
LPLILHETARLLRKYPIFNAFYDDGKVHYYDSVNIGIAMDAERGLKVPVLANITEFGATPLFTIEELRSAGVAIALYPLSAFRAMNKAALNVYKTLRHDGTQRAAVDGMQTRADLYEFLGYHGYEAKLDVLFAKARE